MRATLLALLAGLFLLTPLVGCPTDPTEPVGDDDDDDSTGQEVDFSVLDSYFWRHPMDSPDPQGDNGALDDLREIVYRTNQDLLQIRIDFYNTFDVYNLEVIAKVVGVHNRRMAANLGYLEWSELVLPTDGGDPYFKALPIPDSMYMDAESEPGSIIFGASLQDLGLYSETGPSVQMVGGAVIPYQGEDAIDDLILDLTPPGPNLSMEMVEIIDQGNGDGSPQAGETFTLIPHVISDGELELPGGTEVILTIVEGASTLPVTLSPERLGINGGAPMAIGDRSTTDAPHFTLEIPEWPDCCETGQVLVLSALAEIPGVGQISLGTPPSLVVQ